jgi:glutathione peroxidase
LYDLNYTSINGGQVSLKDYEGKYILIVNTASNCGYTAQYEDLEKLSNDFPEKLVVIGFPSNDFREQEKGTNEEIQQFCAVNFGVSFPLSTKIIVSKGEGQHSVYRWLSDHTMNGWNNTAPSWNFSKYLVDPYGTLIVYADAAIEPAALMSYLGRTG